MLKIYECNANITLYTTIYNEVQCLNYNGHIVICTRTRMYIHNTFLNMIFTLKWLKYNCKKHMLVPVQTNYVNNSHQTIHKLLLFFVLTVCIWSTFSNCEYFLCVFIYASKFNAFLLKQTFSVITTNTNRYSILKDQKLKTQLHILGKTEIVQTAKR